jgi:Ca2+/H+ antiporter
MKTLCYALSLLAGAGGIACVLVLAGARLGRARLFTMILHVVLGISGLAVLAGGEIAVTPLALRYGVGGFPHAALLAGCAALALGIIVFITGLLRPKAQAFLAGIHAATALGAILLLLAYAVLS